MMDVFSGFFEFNRIYELTLKIICARWWCVILWPTGAISQSLSLKEAEQIFLVQDYDLHLRKLNQNLSRKKRLGLKLQWSPQAQLSYSSNRTRPFAGKSITNNSSSLSLSQPLLLPTTYWKQLQQNALEQNLAYLQRRDQFSQSLQKIRNNYFNAVYAQAKVDLIKKQVAILLSMKVHAHERYQKGVIAKNDALRFVIQYQQVALQLKTTTTSVSTALQLLCQLLNKSNSCAFQPNARIKVNALNKDKMASSMLIDKKKVFSVASKVVSQSIAQTNLSLSYDDFLPKFTLGAHVPLHPKNNAKTITFSATWTLWSSGQRYMANYSAKNSLLQAKEASKLAKRDFNLTITQLQQDLDTAVQSWLVQKQIITSLQEVAVASRKRFASGVISAQDLDSDIKASLQGEISLLDYERSIALNLVKYARITNQDGMLYRYLN